MAASLLQYNSSSSIGGGATPVAMGTVGGPQVSGGQVVVGTPNTNVAASAAAAAATNPMMMNSLLAEYLSKAGTNGGNDATTAVSGVGGGDKQDVEVRKTNF